MDAEQRGRLERELDAGLEELGESLEAGRRRLLIEYLGELARWSRAYNLTAVREPAEMVARHVLDSLAARPYLQGREIVDVGTGAGLPGWVLAVAEPDRQFMLLDSGGKKARFVRHVLLRFGPENAAVVQARAQDYPRAGSFDTVISRAFSDLATMLEAAGHLAAPGGAILAMKGRVTERELAAIPSAYRLTATHRLAVPGVAAERNLVALRPRAGSSEP